MRRLALVVVLLAIGLSVFAQARPKDNESIYVRTIPVIKVFTHQLGYKVFYQTNRGGVASVYIPAEWFNHAGGKASITYGSGPQYPYMSVYWINGKFDHIKLFLVQDILADTWDVLREPPAEAAEHFKVDEPKLE
jgi:hypothetical protein